MHRIPKSLLIVLISAIAITVLAACSPSQSAPSASSAPGSASSASSGQVGMAGAEGVVRIPLDYNAGTGYEWSYTAEPEGVLAFVSQVTESQTDDETVAGGPLRDTFAFCAQAPDEVVLTFTLARPWEEGAEPADTQVYAFTVADDLQVILNPYKSRFDNEPEQGANS